MNKAFVREPDRDVAYCPRCGSQGEPVGEVTLAAQVRPEDLGRISSTANFCPSPTCLVAYFDGLERFLLASELPAPVYPKDPSAPICACFGLTADDIEAEVAAGVVTRVRETVQKAESPAADCRQRAANGRRCVALVQRYYMQCLGRK